MAIANYRGGTVSYATRFHFTTDRLDSCPYYRDITRKVAGEECRSHTVTLNRRADAAAGSRSTGAGRARWFTCRARSPGASPAGTMRSGSRRDRVAFVREATLSDGLDVVHESLLWKGGRCSTPRAPRPRRHHPLDGLPRRAGQAPRRLRAVRVPLKRIRRPALTASRRIERSRYGDRATTSAISSGAGSGSRHYLPLRPP
jgi:hypothetical protein